MNDVIICLSQLIFIYLIYLSVAFAQNNPPNYTDNYQSINGHRYNTDQSREDKGLWEVVGWLLFIAGLMTLLGHLHDLIMGGVHY